MIWTLTKLCLNYKKHTHDQLWNLPCTCIYLFELKRSCLLYALVVVDLITSHNMCQRIMPLYCSKKCQFVWYFPIIIQNCFDGEMAGLINISKGWRMRFTRPMTPMLTFSQDVQPVFDGQGRQLELHKGIPLCGLLLNLLPWQQHSITSVSPDFLFSHSLF